MATILVRPDHLLGAIARVQHAVAVDETRPVLTTLCLEVRGETLRLCAADNYRIVVSEIEIQGQTGEWTGQALVPREEIAAIKWVLGRKPNPNLSVELVHDAEHSRLGVKLLDRGVTLRLYDAPFPNVDQVDDKLQTPPSVVTVNPRYLADAGKAAKDHLVGVVIEVREQLTPIVIRALTDDGITFREILMPIRATSVAHPAPANALTAPIPEYRPKGEAVA